MTNIEKTIPRPMLEFLITALAAYMVFIAYSSSPLAFTLLLIIGTMTIPLLLKTPEYAPLFVAPLLPFRDVHIVSIFHVKRILIWSLLLYVIFRCSDSFRKKHNPALRQFKIATALFLLSLVIALFTASEAINTTFEITSDMFRRRVIAYAIIPLDLLAMTYLAYFSVRTPRAIRRLLDITLAVSALIALLGIAQYYFKKPLPALAFLYDPEFVFWGRATSIFTNPNEFGAYLSVMIILAIFACAFETGSSWKRFGFYLPIACMTLLAQFLSFSRGALIQTIIGGLIGFFVYHFKFVRKKISWKLMLFVASLVVLIAFSPTIYDGFMRFRIGLLRETEYQKALYWMRTASDSLRKYTIIQALNAFKEHPIFGVGFNMFSAKNIASGLSPHNQYLKILAEMGLAGFIPFLFMLSSIIMTAWRCLPSFFDRQRHVEEQHLALLLFVGICAAIPGSFFTDSLFSFYVNGNWWLFIGVVFAVAREHSSDASSAVSVNSGSPSYAGSHHVR